MSPPPLSFFSRFVLAFAWFFRALTDGRFAATVQAALLPLAPPSAREPDAEVAAPPAPTGPDHSPALSLLALLQREGRLLDFLMQDITSFGDADVGAAARAVHEGARRTLSRHVVIEPIRSESEGARVTITAGYAAESVKLTGNVHGGAPYTGILRHKGWRAASITLPVPMADHDATVLAPAEVEL